MVSKYLLFSSVYSDFHQALYRVSERNTKYKISHHYFLPFFSFASLSYWLADGGLNMVDSRWQFHKVLAGFWNFTRFGIPSVPLGSSQQNEDFPARAAVRCWGFDYPRFSEIEI